MKYSGVFGATFFMLAISSPASAGEPGQTQLVDMNGKPPYKRKVVNAPEVADTNVERKEPVKTIKKRVVVSYQGKPPYTRRTIEVPVEDSVKQGEDDKPQNGSDNRGSRPPFKR